MNYNEFKVGQRIKKLEDEGDGPRWFGGKITAVEPDKIFILFDDLDEPVECFEDEYKDIRLVR